MPSVVTIYPTESNNPPVINSDPVTPPVDNNSGDVSPNPVLPSEPTSSDQVPSTPPSDVSVIE